jgi:hypothetical protein
MEDVGRVGIGIRDVGRPYLTDPLRVVTKFYMGKLRAKTVIAPYLPAVILNDETCKRVCVEPMEASEGNFQQVGPIERRAYGCDLFHRSGYFLALLKMRTLAPSGMGLNFDLSNLR